MQASIIDGTLTEQASVDGCLTNVGVTVIRCIKGIPSLVSSICKGGQVSYVSLVQYNGVYPDSVDRLRWNIHT